MRGGNARLTLFGSGSLAWTGRNTHVASGVWVMTLPRLAISRLDGWQQATCNPPRSSMSSAMPAAGWGMGGRWRPIRLPDQHRNPGTWIPRSETGYVGVGLVRFELRCRSRQPWVGLVTFRTDPTPCYRDSAIFHPIARDLSRLRFILSCCGSPDRTMLTGYVDLG